MKPRASLLWLFASFALALSVAFCGDLRLARADAPAAASASTGGPMVHGLGQLAGGKKPPLADRPPGATAGDHGPSPVIFPLQQLTIRFNHEKHVQDLGLTCATCHDKAKTSTSSKDSLLPKPTRCDACHGSDHRDLDAVKTDGDDLISQCGFCHVGYKSTDGNRVARMLVPRPNIKMNHAVHLARNIGCGQCHGNVETLELATRDQLPRMRGCFHCHQMPAPSAGTARGDCTNCHLTERGGTMKVKFASGELRPPRWLHEAGHGPDWIERHREVAANDSQFCARCHQESECTDCHDGRVRPRSVHPNDWLSMHPTAARQDNPRCTSCHREQTFCLTCHQRAGVAMAGPYGNYSGRGRVHPPKAIWTDPPRSSGHHAWEAERNLNQCVSCHTERDCAVCHASPGRGGRGWGVGDHGKDQPFGGQGTNPHPRNFLDHCATALRRNARPCLVCHDPADPQLAECR